MWPNSLIVFKNSFSRLLMVVLLTQSLGCGANSFESFSDKTENEALYYQALDGIRDANYTKAIDACGDMTAAYLAETRVAELCASAYAGRCGYKLTTMITDIDTYVASAPPEKLFEYFMGQITSSTATQIDDCDAAESLLRSIGAAAARTDDQNATMVLLAVRKISVIVNETADVTDDGTVDGGFDACNVASITANQAEQIGSAFWELDKSLDALSANTFYATLDTAIDGLCTALAAIGKDLCGATDPTVLNASQVLGARTLIKEGAVVGVDQCGADESLATCNCP